MGFFAHQLASFELEIHQAIKEEDCDLDQTGKRTQAAYREDEQNQCCRKKDSNLEIKVVLSAEVMFYTWVHLHTCMLCVFSWKYIMRF